MQPPEKVKKKKCKRCNCLYEHKRSINTLEYCGKCKVAARRDDNRNKMFEYMGERCSKCGHSNRKSLHAHHKDQTIKEFTISNKLCCSWETIRKELDKCILLCANCHAEEHGSL